MPRINLKIAGAKELDRKLKRLPAAAARTVIRQSLRAGAKVVASEVKSQAPRKTGQLRSAIKVRAMKRKRGVIGVLAQIGAGFFKGKTFYAGFVEFGHKLGKRSKALAASLQRARRIKKRLGLAPKVNDSRAEIPANPFMQDALATSKDRAALIATQQMKAGIEREARK